MSFNNIPFPRPLKVDPVMEELRGMLSLSKTDEGMKDLLDQARMYYALKKPTPTLENEESTAGGYYAPYIPISLPAPVSKKPNVMKRLWDTISTKK